MEYFFKESDRWTRYFYLVGTIVVLPIYAVIQPLWGLFDTDYLGDQYFLKSLVLLLCLWGKVFFFLIVYSLLKNRWLHAYIYTLRFSEATIQEISRKVRQITNIPGRLKNEHDQNETTGE